MHLPIPQWKSFGTTFQYNFNKYSGELNMALLTFREALGQAMKEEMERDMMLLTEEINGMK